MIRLAANRNFLYINANVSMLLWQGFSMGRYLSLTKGFRIKTSTQALQSTQRCEGSPDTKTVGTQKEVERERARENHFLFR